MEFIKHLLLFNEESPLIFTRFYFWGFFVVVLLLYSLIYNKISVRNTFLFLSSLFFYYKTSGFFFFLLIFSTIVDYFIGKGIYRSKVQWYRKSLVALSVVVNLGVLCYFKYAYFFTDSLNSLFNTKLEVVNYLALWSNQLTGTHFNISRILLPVGISFFTFQTISYSVDIYRGKTTPVNNIIDFGFYVSFFPQLVAGPIVRASEFVPQLYKKFSLSKYEFGSAIFLILNGLTKKIFIGDFLAVNFIDRVFENPLSFTGFENLMALYGYSLQVYCDFSGYTDIAIGVALLLGFQLPRNFNSPYKAINVGDFWKRWHISLSSWLRDYLYIPIGGNRKGKMRTNINLMITMLLGGLWHGASWNFVLWGGINGIGLIVYKYWKRISPYEKKNNLFVHFWKVLITFNFITFTRIFFRAEDTVRAKDMMFKISHDFSGSLIPEIVLSYYKVFLMMIFGYIIHWLPSVWKEYIKDWFIYAPLWLKIVLSSLVVFIVYQSVSSELVPFIYFQF